MDTTSTDPTTQSDSDTTRADSMNDRLDPLCFTAVKIDRLYSTRHGLSVGDLSPGINIVYGPNASGKTTLARGLRGLLWPDTLQEHSAVPILNGRYHVGDTLQHTAIDGDAITHQQSGQPAPAPSLPPKEHERRYYLHLHDLIAATEGSDPDAFAQAILQEAVGGYDIDAAAEALDFGIATRTTGHGTVRAVESAREAMREAEDEQQALQSKQRALDGLRKKLEEARDAETRATALEKAMDVAHARTAHEEAQAQVDGFPEAVSEMQGDELERVETLESKQAEAERKKEKAEATIEEAEATLASNVLPDDGLPEGHLAELKTRASTLKNSEDTLRTATSDLEAAQTKENEAWSRLRLGTSKEKAAAIDAPAIEEVEAHVETAETARHNRKALQALKQLFGDAKAPEHRDALRDGLQHLHRWMQHADSDEARAPHANGSAPQRWRHVTFGVSAAAAVLGIILLALGISVVAGLALLVLGAVVATIEIMRPNPTAADETDTGPEEHVVHRRAFDRLSLDPPESWTPDAVEQRADALLQAWTEAELEAQKAREWERKQGDFDAVKNRIEELADERASLAQKLGLNPDTSQQSLSWIADRLSQWQSAYDRVQALRDKCDRAERTIENDLERIQDLLDPYELDPVEDAADAQRAVTTLETAHDEWREATRDRKQATRKKQDAEQQIADATEARNALYDRLGLSVGDRSAVRERVDQYDAYKEALDAQKEAAVTLQTEQNGLRRQDAHAPWMEDASLADLQQKHDAARRKADAKDDHFAEIERIEQRVEQAEKGGDLEAKQARYRQTRDALARMRTRDTERALGKVFADHVRTATRDQDLPPVFRRARELFAEVTQGRYELRIDAEHSLFRALDTVHDQERPLNALSSGTRVQLLLCVRMAFIETQETHYRLPLVLDETLANSDDTRADAIIDAVRTISAQGRQILYLTAQRDEVAKWTARLQDDDSVPFTTIPLGDGMPPASPALSAQLPVRPRPTASADLPDPSTTDHDAYGAALDIPHWTPRDPVPALHLWYLVEHVPLLHALLEQGTLRWGQLDTLAQRGGSGVLDALTASTAAPVQRDAQPEPLPRIRARVQAVSAWKDAWSIGRGMPVDRAALEQSGAVSSNFIDGVSELAAELNGDAEALLHELRTRQDERTHRFHSAKADELENFLEAKGYLDPNEPLSNAALWQHVLADLQTEQAEGLIDVPDLERLFARIKAGPKKEREEPKSTA